MPLSNMSSNVLVSRSTCGNVDNQGLAKQMDSVGLAQLVVRGVQSSTGHLCTPDAIYFSSILVERAALDATT
jgi:hypothetical protein